MDIRRTMNIPYANVLKGDLTRSNLQYTVRTKSPEYVKDIVETIKHMWNDKCGIIYCLTRDEADQMNQTLNVSNRREFEEFRWAHVD